jgi:hypothetical protein
LVIGDRNGRGLLKTSSSKDGSPEEMAISIGHILLIEFTSRNKNAMKLTEWAGFYFLGK